MYGVCQEKVLYCIDNESLSLPYDVLSLRSDGHSFNAVDLSVDKKFDDAEGFLNMIHN